MTFLHPLGLLGLIGIPILILVYILKNRYTEQTIAATYLWRLSERFLKKRNPLSRITGIISLILQLLLVATLSLAIAHPIITLKGAANEYCFVLDGSASMSMQTNGKTRFDAAKSEINKIIDKANDGSVFTLVYVTDITETVFELEDSKALAKERIANLKCSDCAIDYTDSIGVAQRIFNQNSSVLTYLVTDEDYSEHTNVEVINVQNREKNASIYDVKYQSTGTNSYIVSGKAISNGGDVVSDIEVRNNVENRPLATARIEIANGIETTFEIAFESEAFYSLTVSLLAEDSMMSDNTAKVYDLKVENSYKTLLVSDTPFLLKSAIEAVSSAEITVMSYEDYKELEANLTINGETPSGYGLYIYDAYNPAILPDDGTIWFVGPTENISGAGFSVQGEVEFDDGVQIELNKSSNSVMKKLTNGLTGDSAYVKKFTKCGIFGDFKTIYSYIGNPVIFTGESSSGNREVVFAFNLHDTNFTLLSDYPILLYNLLEYSFPAVLDRAEYYAGETVTVNVIPGCTGIRVTPPSGQHYYVDSLSAVSEVTLGEVGEYKITLESSGSSREFYIYSSIPMDERVPEGTGASPYNIVGAQGNSKRDGKYDPIVIFFICAALFFTAEWMVYCYDKYQLR